MRPVDADKLIIDVMKQAVVTDDSYGMGISRGIDIAINVINDAPTVDPDETREETVRDIIRRIDGLAEQAFDSCNFVYSSILNDLSEDIAKEYNINGNEI